MSIGPFRDSAVIASILSSAPTVVATWPGPNAGVLAAVYLHSLSLGEVGVSAYVIPRGVTAGADALLVGPKDVVLPHGNTLDFEMIGPVYLNAGDQIAFSATITNYATAVVSMKEFKE